MEILWILFLSVLLLVGILYLLGGQDEKKYQSQGVHYIGNITFKGFVSKFKGISLPENTLLVYKEAKKSKEKFVAMKEFGKVGILLTDLDLIKKVLVKDFDHFVDRREMKIPTNDYLMNKMLIFLRSEKWKALRSKMSPTFTTGKIRRMFKIFDQSSKKLVSYIDQQIGESGEMDIQDGYSKFTMDVIATAAVGLDSKAFDQVGPSVFEQMGTQMQFRFKGLHFFSTLAIVIVPRLADFLGLSFFPKKPQDFFSEAIKSAITHRTQSGQKRDDFIQLMLEAREGKGKVDESELNDFEKEAIVKTDESSSKVSLEDDDIVAQCVLFIIGGFDMTQSLLIWAAYALATHKDIQDRLVEEISNSLEETDGEFTYDSVNKMEYLDMVINETLRYYSPSQVTDRGCTKDYKVPDSDFIIKKGVAVSIPIFGIHRDEKYYPEPEKFDPERFSPQNRPKIHPCAFMPFGSGPRNCIAVRFAVTEVKVAIARLVHEFTMEPSEKMSTPVKFADAVSLKPEGGMWLKLNRRE